MDQLETLHRRKCYLEWLLVGCNGSINQAESMLKEVPLPPKNRIETITRLSLMGLVYTQKSTQQVYLAQYAEVLRELRAK